MKRLWVVGPALRGSGYPNAEQTIAILRASGEWEIEDRADWLPPGMHLWRLVRGTAVQRVRLALRLGFSSLKQAVGALAFARRDDWIYVPYPAPLTLWWLSFCPARWRPKCIADAYISIWDSMFRDRAQSTPHGLLSRLVWRFERRSLHAAHRILVDTKANRTQMVEDFGLQKQRVISVPLAIDEHMFLSISPKAACQGTPLRVLFVGTLVPLHGINSILEAVEILANDDRFEFRLVGDGQMANVVEAFVQRMNPGNFTWIRGWYELGRIADEISRADICLGVFGGGEKAARVLPFKLYMYFAAGKPVITQASMSQPGDAPAVPVLGTDPIHLSIAGALCSSVVNPDRLQKLAEQSRSYYLQWLCNSRLADAWKKVTEPFN